MLRRVLPARSVAMATIVCVPGLPGVFHVLVKGAAGQAIQNFNVAFGFEETMGLN